MWQNILVFAVLAMAGGYTLWQFYSKFTGKSSCCGGGCTCKGSCGSGGAKGSGIKDHRGITLQPLSGGSSCCSR